MQIKKIKLASLVEAVYNPRKITEKQKVQIENSLNKFSLVEPLVININKDRKNIVIGGHQRLKILQSMGYKESQVSVVDLNEKDEKELNIRLNKNMGDFDMEMLLNQFSQDELKNYGFQDFEFPINTEGVNDVITQGKQVLERTVKDLSIIKFSIGAYSTTISENIYQKFFAQSTGVEKEFILETVKRITDEID